MLGEFVPTARDETFHTVCMIFAQPRLRTADPASRARDRVESFDVARRQTWTGFEPAYVETRA